MVLPIDYLEAARTLRREAAAQGELVDRARMLILAERFEQLAKDLETELAGRARG
jgi:hypothetical protein